jgi:hypothetical protein
LAASNCPYCKAAIPPGPLTSDDFSCPACGERVFVREHMTTRWFLTRPAAQAWDSDAIAPSTDLDDPGREDVRRPA